MGAVEETSKIAKLNIKYLKYFSAAPMNKDAADWLKDNNMFSNTLKNSLFLNIYDAAINKSELSSVDGSAISFCVATKEDGSPIGICMCRHYFLIGSSDKKFNGVVGVYVHPSYRGYGLGESLIHEWYEYHSNHESYSRSDIFIASGYCYKKTNELPMVVVDGTGKTDTMSIVEDIIEGIAAQV